MKPARFSYEAPKTLEAALASLAQWGDDAKIIEMYMASAEDGRLGIPVRRTGERIDYAFPITILAATKPD